MSKDGHWNLQGCGFLKEAFVQRSSASILAENRR